MTSIRNAQEVKSSSQASKTITEEDNRICYKKIREELNQRVKSVLEHKKQIANARNYVKELIRDIDESSSRFYYFPKRTVRI